MKTGLPPQVPPSRLLVIKSLSKRDPQIFRAPLTDNISTTLEYTWSALIGFEGVGTLGRAAYVGQKVVEYAKRLAHIPGSVFNIGKIPKQVGIRPSLTTMIGGYPDHLVFPVRIRLWTVEDVLKDVHEPLMTLREMCTPAISSWGVYNMPYVSMRVGNLLYLRRAAIKSLSENHSKTMIDGYPAWVDIELQVSTIQIVDRSKLRSIYPLSVRVGTKQPPVVEA